jgi:hypothetical protein
MSISCQRSRSGVGLQLIVELVEQLFASGLAIPHVFLAA